MSSRVGIRVLLFAIWFLCVAAAFNITGSRANDEKYELARRAREVLTGRCFQCHGQNGVARNNVFVLDHTRLLSSKTVIAGDGASLLFKVVESDAMPLGGPPLSREEKATLRSWVLAGAPDWDGALTHSPARTFISGPAITAMIRDDLVRAGEHTPVSALLQHRSSLQRRCSRGGAREPSSRSCQAHQQPLLAPRHYPAWTY